MRRFKSPHSWTIFSALLLAIVMSGCGAADHAALPSSQLPANPAAQADQVISHDDFTLRVLAESFIDGAAAQFDFTALPQLDGSQLIEVHALNAVGLKALYFELDYDAACMSPVAARASGELAATAGADLLELAILDQPGQLQHGQVLAQWETAAGLSGTHVLATIILIDKPMAAVRAVTSVPQTANAEAPLRLLRSSPTAMQLEWWYTNPGDYDQNGVVGIADLTPLGQYFGAQAAGGQFDYASVQAVIDGDANGEINISDLSTIGAGFGRRIESWNVYESLAGDEYPEPTAPSTISPLTAVQLGDGPLAGRRVYHCELPAATGELRYWVRPVFGSTEGTPSNRSDQPNGLGNQPPVVIFEASTTTGELPLSVLVDTGLSYDPDGDIAGFRVDLPLQDDVVESDLSSFGLLLTQNANYSIAVEAHDDSELTALSAPQLITVTAGGNSAPVAVLQINNTTGNAPFLLSADLSASTDTDGPADIVSYALILDYGNPSEGEPPIIDGGADPQIGTTLDEPAKLEVYGIVTDSAGATAYSERITVEVLDASGNHAPEARFRIVAPPEIDAPVSIVFEDDGCLDVDGEIVSIMLDPDDSGTLVPLSGPGFSYSHEFAEPGIYVARLFVEDNSGLMAMQTLYVFIGGSGGTPPVASLIAAPLGGEAPVEINLDATGSFDANGRIVAYEFNAGDGGGWESWEFGSIFHIYEQPGVYYPEVRVIDNQGLGSTASAEVTITSDLPPVAVLNITPDSGIMSFEAILDASGSTDADGSIVKYEYAFGVNGQWEDNGGNPLRMKVFDSVGAHLVNLRVTDDDGLTAQVSQVVQVSPIEF